MSSSPSDPTRQVHVAVGAVAAALPADPGAQPVVLHLGTHHPSNHGGLRLRVSLDAHDRIATCDPEVGFLHRGAEKLFEVRDYRQVMALANRHDWLSAAAGELGVALAVERMLGLPVPERAVWLRTLLAELNRVTHHLLFLGALPPSLGTVPPATRMARERLLGVVEELTGGRMHVMFTRVGGVREDLPAGWLDRLETAITATRPTLTTVAAALAHDDFRAATRGVGVLTREDAAAYGLSGAVARASGLDADLRRDDPVLAYGDLADVLRVPVRTEGDALARFEVLLEQAEVALDLVSACVARLRALPPGPVNVKLPKILKAPEGTTYQWTEAPGGILGYLLVSHGEKTPWRLKLRTPGFATAAALPALVPGSRVQDLVPLLASLFYVVGDIDK